MLRNLLRRMFRYSTSTQQPFPRKPVPSSRQEHAFLLRGRRHLSVSYLLPKDFQEKNRLDFQHHLIHQLLGGKNYLAPVPQSVTAILDVGTGTARWAHDVAGEFSAAHVVGVDLEEMKVTSNVIPTNYKFTQCNVLQGLPFPADSFDYVHQRLLVAGLPAGQWPSVVQELVRVLRPGGWIELLEGGDYISTGDTMQLFLTWARNMSVKRGIDASLMSELDILLANTGLLHTVKKQTIKTPIGWGGRTGDMLAKDTLAAFEALQGPICETLALPPELVYHALKKLPSEWKQYRTYFQFYVAYGCKKNGNEYF